MNNKSLIEYAILFVVIPVFLTLTILLLSSVIYTTSTGQTFNFGFVKMFLIFLGIIAGSIILHYIASIYIDIYLRLRIFSRVIFPLFAGAMGMYLAIKMEMLGLGSSTPAIIRANLSITDALIFGLVLMIPTFLVCLTIDWGGREVWSSAKEEAE